MRKDFDNIQPPDHEQFWPDAEKMLDQHFQQKRRNKRIAFISITVLGLLVTSYFLTSYMQQSAQSPFTNRNTTVPSNLSSDTELRNIEKETKYAHNLADPKNKKEITTISNGKSSTTLIPSSDNDVSTGKKSIENAIAVPDTKPRVQSKLNSKITLNQPGEKMKSGEKSTESLALIRKSEVTIEKDQEVEITIPYKNSIAENEIIQARSHNEISLLQPLKNHELQSRDVEYKLQTKELLQSPEVSDNKTKSALAFSFYIGASSVSKKLESEESTHFLERRTQEEKNIIVPVLGINLGWIKNNFSSSLGLEYSYLGENTIYGAYSEQTNYTQVGNWQTFNHMVTDTDTAYVSGLHWFLHTQVNQLDSTYNSYTDTSSVRLFDPSVSEHNGVTKFYYVEIPIMIRYQLPYKRFALGLSAGISPAWLTSEKGYYLKEDQSGVESVTESKPLKTFILNGRIGIDLSYSLNPRLNLFVSPGLKKNLKSISNSDQVVRQKYTSTGISLGLVYKIK